MIISDGSDRRFSPVMQAVKHLPEEDWCRVCNGFQILLGSGLLPGAMLRNKSPALYLSRDIRQSGERCTPFPMSAGRAGAQNSDAYAMGIFTDPVTLAGLQANAQVVFRYCTADGKVTPEACLNGSLDNIAGIRNAEGNVLGMMPHPERCAEAMLGNDDGRAIFQSMIASLTRKELAGTG